jgi:hypothetical protein
MPNPLTVEEWDDFFEMMERIINAPGDWHSKKEAVQSEAENRDNTSVLNEFTNWFPPEE